MKEQKVVRDVKSFVVERDTWYRGKGDEKSCLLNNANNKCCLGFYALACGIEPKVIRNMSSPGAAAFITNGDSVFDIYGNDVTRSSNLIWKTKLANDKASEGYNSPTCCALMQVNDDEKLSDEDREKKLKSLFKRIGITVRFK